jgi:hypothetical protein
MPNKLGSTHALLGLPEGSRPSRFLRIGGVVFLGMRIDSCSLYSRTRLNAFRWIAWPFRNVAHALVIRVGALGSCLSSHSGRLFMPGFFGLFREIAYRPALPTHC